MAEGRRAGASVFARVLGVVVAAGLVAVAFVTIATVQVVRRHVEAELVESAVARTELLAAEVDHDLSLALSQLQAVGLAAAGGQVMEVPSVTSGPIEALRCLRGGDEVLDAAVSPEAHEVLRSAGAPRPGEPLLLDDGRVVLSAATGDIRTQALLDMREALSVPAGWGARLVPAAQRSSSLDASAPDLPGQALVGGVLASRSGDGHGEERVTTTTVTPQGLGVEVTAPLGPARAAAFGVIGTVLTWSSLALLPLVLLALILARAVTSPVRSLAKAVRDAHDAPVALPRLPADEIGDLGAAIGTMSSRLHADAEALRTAVAFARGASAHREVDEVLAALEGALAEALPGAEWHVLSRAAIDEGALPASLGLSQEELARAISSGLPGKTSPPDRGARRGASDRRLSGFEIPVQRIAEARVLRLQVVLRHEDDVYGLVVGHAGSDEELSARHTELLCRVAVAAMRNVGLLRSLLSNEKLAVLGRVSAQVTHEMSNPLAFVLANLRVLERDLDGEAREVVAESRAGAERLERIVRDLSSLARGGVLMELEDLDLVEAARRAARIARSRTRGAVVEVEETGAVAICADGGRVEQILLNLIANGLDAAAGAGANPPRVTVSVRAQGDRAIARVRDNGPGLAPPAIRHLFEAFFTTKGTDGTGLGLYLSRSLAQAQGGELEMEETGKDGTTFRLLLPLSVDGEGRRAASTPQAVEIGSMLVPGQRPKVLVVDDELSLVRALSRWLSQYAEVVGTTDPMEALDLAEKEFFALILCDLNMPSMPGTEFIAALSDRNPDAAARVVIMTGSGGASLSGVRVVSKPLQPAVIEEIFRAR